MRIREIAQARVRYGYRKMRVLLNREGWDVGKYLVYRLYTEEGLTLKRMKPAGKRKASRTREDRIKPTAPSLPVFLSQGEIQVVVEAEEIGPSLVNDSRVVAGIAGIGIHKYALIPKALIAYPISSGQQWDAYAI